jgi:hypothetical protein
VTALALLASSVGCGSSPTAPGQPVTDTFPGVLPAGNTNIYTFTTTAGGSITITLVSLSPVVTVEVNLGAVVNGGCNVEYANTGFTMGTQWVTSVNLAGTYCFSIDDLNLNNAPATLTYTFTVLHP